MKEKVIDYLLSEGEDWLQYAIRFNLLNEPKDTLNELKNQLLNNDKIINYLNDLKNFHSILVRNHKDPELPIHKLLFLIDIGLDDSVPEIRLAINQILMHKDKNNIYQSLTNIPKHFGGNGEDTFGWCLCDAPLLLLALIKLGVDYDTYIKGGVEYLVSLYKIQGFPCFVSDEFGKFRGPGRKDDCCPYATLIMLKLLAEIPEYKDSEISKNIIDVILSLWQNSREKHPYMFYMGTDFRKLKAPLMWYDILSVVDCLSKFEYAIHDDRFKEMVKIISDKQTEEGLFIPESVYQKFKNWDFGQKNKPSPYLTYLCYKVLNRIKKEI